MSESATTLKTQYDDLFLSFNKQVGDLVQLVETQQQRYRHEVEQLQQIAKERTKQLEDERLAFQKERAQWNEVEHILRSKISTLETTLSSIRERDYLEELNEDYDSEKFGIVDYAPDDNQTRYLRSQTIGDPSSVVKLKHEPHGAAWSSLLRTLSPIDPEKRRRTLSGSSGTLPITSDPDSPITSEDEIRTSRTNSGRVLVREFSGNESEDSGLKKNPRRKVNTLERRQSDLLMNPGKASSEGVLSSPIRKTNSSSTPTTPIKSPSKSRTMMQESSPQKRAIKSNSQRFNTINLSRLMKKSVGTIRSKEDFRKEISKDDSLLTEVVLLNEDQVFGVPLNSLHLDESGVPTFVIDTVTYLEPKDLKNGKAFIASVNDKEVKKLKETVKSSRPDFTELKDHQIAARMLRQFFEDLPSPLFPVELQDKWLIWNEIDDQSYRIISMQSLINSLPFHNRQLLLFMLNFFRKIAPDSAAKESRSASHLATAFGPVFLRLTESANLPSKKFTELKNVSMKAVDFMIVHYPNLYEVDTEDIKFQGKDGMQIVSAATLEKILEKSADVYYKDSDFLDVILLTHSYFITSSTLLEKFIELFVQNDPKRPWQYRIRIRILENLRSWIKNYSDNIKKEERFIALLKNFITQVQGATKDEENVFNFMKAVLSVMEMTPKESEFAKLRTSAVAVNVEPIDILQYTPVVIAQQVTLIDHDLLKAIEPNELMQCNFNNSKVSPSFATMVGKFNEWTFWVQCEVVKQEKTATRSNLIVHFIKVADTLRSYRNFHGCYAIIAGLNSSSVSRLKLSWDKIPKRYLDTYESLCDLFDMSHNFKKYREALQESQPPLVPYLGLYPKDLTSLEETPTFVVGQLINFDKMRTIRKIVAQLRQFQLRSYHEFTVVQELNAYLKHLKLLSPDDTFKLSLEREPRQSNHHK